MFTSYVNEQDEHHLWQWQCGILNISQPYRSPRPVTGNVLLSQGIILAVTSIRSIHTQITLILYNNGLNISNIWHKMEQDETVMNGEYGRSCCDLFWGTILVFALRNLGKPKLTPDETAGPMPGLKTGYIQYMSLYQSIN
jgi:hypothetical protein